MTSDQPDPPPPLPEAYHRQQEQLREERTLRGRFRRVVQPLRTVIADVFGDGSERR